MSRQFLQLKSRRLAYALVGQGPPVLFIQGVGLHGDGWAPQTDVMAERFQCLSFDHRGTGESPWDGLSFGVPQLADDAIAIMDEVGWESCHVVGHSLGGLVALQLALTQKWRVRSLSLLCTAANGRKFAPTSTRMIMTGLKMKFGSAATKRKAFLGLILSPKGMAKGLDVRQAARLKPIFGHDLAETPAVVPAQLKALRRFDATPRLAELFDVPTFVMSAVFDPIAPPAAGKALAKGIRGARFVEMGDASHGAPIEHAARVNASLREHIAAVEAKRPV